VEKCSDICQINLRGLDFADSLKKFNNISAMLPLIMEIKIDGKSQHKYLDCYHKLKDQFADNVYPKIEEIISKAEGLSAGSLAQKRKILSELNGISKKLLDYTNLSDVLKSSSVFQRLENMRLYFNNLQI
jgi:hypothetical protein